METLHWTIIVESVFVVVGCKQIVMGTAVEVRQQIVPEPAEEVQ